MKPSKTTSTITDLSNGQTTTISTTTTTQNKLDIGVKKILCPLLAMPNETIKHESFETEKISESRIVAQENSEKNENSKNKSSKSHKYRSRSKSKSYSPSSRSSDYSSDDKKSSRKHKNKRKDRRGSRSRHNKSRRRSRSNSSNEGKDRKRRRSNNELPVVGQIYDGTVSSIMQFGCFVQMSGLKKQWEGLVHISNVLILPLSCNVYSFFYNLKFNLKLRKEGRVSLVSDVVTRHQKLKVKCIHFTGTKVGLSIKDVDQKTGEDLNPQHTKRLLTQQQSNTDETSHGNAAEARNPDRPDNYSEVPIAEEDLSAKKKVKQISDYEKWEIQRVSKKDQRN